MRQVVCSAFAVALLAAPLAADDVFADMAGDWRGTGQYIDRNINEDLRCRMTVTHDGAITLFDGVCASARQREAFAFEITSEAGQLTGADRSGRRGVPQLSGRATENGMILEGQQRDEDTRLSLTLTDAGVLELDTQTLSPDRMRALRVAFTR